MKKIVWQLLFGRHQIDRFRRFLPVCKTAIDLGCGLGDLTHSLKNNLNFVVGMDLSKELVQHAHKCYPIDDFIVGDAQRTPIKDDVFDIVTLFDVLHHARSPELVLSEATRISKGYLIIGEVGIFNKGILRLIEKLWLRVTDGGYTYLERDDWRAKLPGVIIYEDRYGALKRSCLFIVDIRS